MSQLKLGEFFEQRYNQQARLICRGKWKDQDAGIEAAKTHARTNPISGWEFDEITTRQHPDGWWWIEIRYRPADPV